jgi:hypothetical protein
VVVALPPALDEFEIVADPLQRRDEAGHVLPHQVTSTDSREVANMPFDRQACAPRSAWCEMAASPGWSFAMSASGGTAANC